MLRAFLDNIDNTNRKVNNICQQVGIVMQQKKQHMQQTDRAIHKHIQLIVRLKYNLICLLLTLRSSDSKTTHLYINKCRSNVIV